MSEIGDRIKRRRKELGLSQMKLGEAVKLSQQSVQQIEKGDIDRPKKLTEIARALKTSEEWLLGETQDTEPRGLQETPIPFEPVVPNASSPRPTTLTAGQPRDLPVLGRAVGGDGDWFELNQGEALDYVFRPPALDNVRTAYAVFVSGTSMFPRYIEGEIAYVNPTRPVGAGDFVVAQIRPARKGDAIRGIIKQLKAKSAGEIILNSLNPPNAKLLRFPADQVLSLHMIVLAGEPGA